MWTSNLRAQLALANPAGIFFVSSAPAEVGATLISVSSLARASGTRFISIVARACLMYGRPHFFTAAMPRSNSVRVDSILAVVWIVSESIGVRRPIPCAWGVRMQKNKILKHPDSLRLLKATLDKLYRLQRVIRPVFVIREVDTEWRL